MTAGTRNLIWSRFDQFVAAGVDVHDLSLDGDLWLNIFAAVFETEPKSNTDPRWDQLLHGKHGGLALAKEYRDEYPKKLKEAQERERAA